MSYNKSDHFDGEHFYNPNSPEGLRSQKDVLRWKLAGEKIPWPDSIQNKKMVTLPSKIELGETFITSIGHISRARESRSVDRPQTGETGGHGQGH